MLSIFELVKSVLDEEYGSITPEAERDPMIRAQFMSLSGAYKDLETLTANMQ